MSSKRFCTVFVLELSCDHNSLNVEHLFSIKFPLFSIIYDEKYYWFTTSTFEYFPGLPLYKSEDCEKWSFETYILSSPDLLDLRNAENSKGGIYAATLRYHKGVY